MNVGILFSDFGPYHVARIEALSSALEAEGSQLFAFQFSEKSTTYSWRPVLPEDVKVVTLAQKSPVGVADALNMAMAFRRVLKKYKVDVVFLPSYSPLPNLFCLLCVKSIGCKAVLMNESWHGTEKASLVGRLAKHLIVRLFDAALVGGAPQKEYACSYGQKRSNVFLGYDVIDVNYYGREAKRWENTPTKDLPIPNLPTRYFLNLGRFVDKKNIGLLIKAYAQLMKHEPSANIALVLVGEGDNESALRQLADEYHLRIRNGLEMDTIDGDRYEVVFYPFQQIDKTPFFFAHCEAFILPSLYEEWGLVINEAMACGAAVLVSDNVGCAQDLIDEGKNGFRFNPTNVDQLTNLLQRFSLDPTLARRLGQCGATIIQQWGPERFADGALNAIRVLNKNSPVVEAMNT